RLGVAGGLGSPSGVAAAFALGAAYVVTGSVNQGAVEAGLSETGRQLLAHADLADMAMAPSADMFELGVKVQVLRRGTLFPQRARKLFEIYRTYGGLEEIPAAERTRLETEILRDDPEAVWQRTRAYFLERNPEEVTRAERDPKYRMALVFRWYLFMASQWPMDGLADRQQDYQIWCGPAMGTYNRWVAGSFMEPVEKRTVVQIARNLLEGAAVISRAQQLRSHGVAVPAAAFDFRPRYLNG
ncbi:MAG: 2-nitropropane dioxygenase, partial [Magnetococcales bacterium]|nr:2-nitropropane dioxygenase [Magnetococcales bacterium]